MASVYTVGKINAYIKNMFTQDFMLQNVWVKGEVSNCKYHTSGHIYFTLKDASGVIACVMFASNRKGLTFTMKEGQKIKVHGSVNVYERDGKYQLYAKEIELDGAGELYEKFEKLKITLEEMGMFDQQYKQPIPQFAMRVGVVTASTGAAIQDIINISHRRNPYVQLILYPALVQGQGAVPSIINGIHCLSQQNVDVIIVGRGGGSIEDLWAFNEELVARAIFECPIPIISAVGHETDVTIADFVADMRAPTPSAAAEMAVFEYNLFAQRLSEYQYSLLLHMNRRLHMSRSKLENLTLRLQHQSPRHKLLQKKQYLSNMQEKLQQQIHGKVQTTRHKLAICAQRLEGVSPLKRLSGGFAYVNNQKGQVVHSIAQMGLDEELTLTFRDGQAKTKVTELKPTEEKEK